MASKKNPGEEFTGRVGDTVTYYLGDILVKRIIGESNQPNSASQQAFYKLSREVNSMLQPVKDFIGLGYALDVKGTKRNTMNSAYSNIFKNAIMGTSPDLEIDFTKVLFSKGAMEHAPELAVKAIEGGLEFSWSKDVTIEMRWDDTVMLMAYIPSLNSAQYILGGARRAAGKDVLPIVEIQDGTLIHTYITFVSADQKNITNSTYTGTIMWNDK